MANRKIVTRGWRRRAAFLGVVVGALLGLSAA